MNAVTVQVAKALIFRQVQTPGESTSRPASALHDWLQDSLQGQPK
jgi:hypothetical protein